MSEAVAGNGELEGQRIAKSGALPSHIVLGSELEEVRSPILNDPLHDGRIANAL